MARNTLPSSGQNKNFHPRGTDEDGIIASQTGLGDIVIKNNTALRNMLIGIVILPVLLATPVAYNNSAVHA